MRIECMWCAKPHPMDGKGLITQAERESGEVRHSLCDEAQERLEGDLQSVSEQAEAEERQALLRYVDTPLPETDEAGIDTRVIRAERNLYWLSGAVAVVALITSILALVL